MMRWTGGMRRALARTPVLIGHSHTDVVFKAARTAGRPLKGFDFWTAPQPWFNPERTRFNPEISRVLSEGPVFSAVGGAVHHTLALIRHPRPFDFILPGRGDLPLDPAAEILPFGAVRETLAQSLQEYLDIMRLVRVSAGGPVFHLQSPPPLEDAERILPDVPWIYFRGLTQEVAPAALRYKCWRLHSDLVAEFCERERMTLIPPPAEAVDARGYLKPGYYGDAMHVNEAYGALVLDQIRAAIGRD